MHPGDAHADGRRIAQVLAGLTFPAAKWQLLMQAEYYGADAPTRAQLWALRVGTFADLTAVLEALHLPVVPRGARITGVPRRP